MMVLGLNAHHADAAAALIVDGRVVAAAEEERFTRVKHFAGFPAEAARWCLSHAGIDAREVEHVGVNTDPGAARLARLAFALRHPPSPARVLEALRTRGRRLDVLAQLSAALGSPLPRARLHAVPHHLAHLASAYFAAPWDEALAVSVDGSGDFATAAWGRGRGSALALEDQVAFPHSLGVFYQAMTQYLGFPNYGDEYKVMGLAPYGEPRFASALREVLRTGPNGEWRLDLRWFRHARERTTLEPEDGRPRFAPLFQPRLASLLGPPRASDEPLEQRHRDLARSVQDAYEGALFGWLSALHARHPASRLALAGGSAQNSVANGKVVEQTPFRELYVAAAGYDAGGALGAALATWHALGGARCEPLPHAQLGPAFDDDAIGHEIAQARAALDAAGCRAQRLDDPGALDAEVVELLQAGGVVGWFQGRMEWGPRALGQRSILADPRRANIRELLNRKIKRRESFRPFAPSVLREHVADWFARDVDVPFMGEVLPIRPERRAAIPAVTHVDGTGRLQTVTRQHNARYHALISAFHARTGVPMLLNTSFNENEPIVCHPREALDCFLRTRMDGLAIGSWLLRRPQEGEA
jgi:carbamoyltransferase